MNFLFVSLLVFFVYFSQSSFVCLFQDKTEVRVFEVENAGDNEKIVEISTGPKGSKKYLTCFILILREFVGAEGGASMHQNNVAIHNKFEKYTQTQNTTQYQTIFPITPKNTLCSLLSLPVSMTFSLLLTNLPGQLQRTRPLG